MHQNPDAAREHTEAERPSGFHSNTGGDWVLTPLIGFQNRLVLQESQWKWRKREGSSPRPSNPRNAEEGWLPANTGGRGIEEGGVVDIFKNKVLSHPQLHSEFKTSLVWMGHQPPPKMAGALGTSEEKLAPGDLQLQGNSGTRSEVGSRPGRGQCSLVVHVLFYLNLPSPQDDKDGLGGGHWISLSLIPVWHWTNLHYLLLTKRKIKKERKNYPQILEQSSYFIFFWKILFNKHVLFCLQ